MKKLITEKGLSRVFNTFSIVVFAMLFCFSFSSSWVTQRDLQQEYVHYVPDSMVYNLLGIVVVLLLGGLVCYGEKKHPLKCNMDIVAAVFCVISVVFSVYWVSAASTSPQGDQHAIILCAEEFAAGDYSRLEKGEYVGIYPQQLGLISFTGILFDLFGVGNYRAFQYFNAHMVGLLIFSGYQIIKKLTKGNKRIELFYLLMMSVCVPLYCYVPFVYGEIGSTSLVMFAAWMLLSAFDKFSYAKIILMSVALGFAVQLRKNALIFVVAFLIVLLIRLFRGVKKQDIIAVCGALLGVILFQACIDYTYGKLTPEDSQATPNIAYIAMGVNDDNGNAGWHNGYDQDVIRENDFDAKKAGEASKEYLAQFVAKCKANPGYAVDFYYRKINMQWNVPMYQCLAMNSWIAEGQSKFVESVYFGKLRGIVEGYMNIYQLVVFGSILFLLLSKRKEWNSIENYLLLIGVFGGFLFSIIWEAKARYVFPYFIIMLPYAAIGIHECLDKLIKKLSS